MRVDFYVSPSAQPQARLELACRLARKAWQSGLATFIRCADEQQVEQIDELLWSFRAEYFLPHDTWQNNPQSPIVLATQEQCRQTNPVLINLSLQMPALNGFNRIIEIVCQDSALLQHSRNSFLHYRQQGCQPQRVEL